MHSFSCWRLMWLYFTQCPPLDLEGSTTIWLWWDAQCHTFDMFIQEYSFRRLLLQINEKHSDPMSLHVNTSISTNKAGTSDISPQCQSLLAISRGLPWLQYQEPCLSMAVQGFAGVTFATMNFIYWSGNKWTVTQAMMTACAQNPRNFKKYGSTALLGDIFLLGMILIFSKLKETEIRISAV